MDNSSSREMDSMVLPLREVNTKRSNAFDVDSLSPKRAKRIISNRQAAHRSRRKKIEQIHTLRDQVHWLLQEHNSLLSQLSAMQAQQLEMSEETTRLDWQLEQLQHEEEREKARETYLSMQTNYFAF
jgi:septal ring factor EnvC (AmiA/AmiB activator)